MKQYFTLASIIVNYKSEERTIKYIQEELLPKNSIPQVIIIVNNGATTQSSNTLSCSLKAPIVADISTAIEESSIYIIHNVENSGFAKGNNLGVNFITSHFKVDYLLFSNNDIRFIDSNIIETLIHKLKNLPDVGIIGPKVIGLDGKNQNPYIYTPFWNEMLNRSWGRFIPGWKLIDLDRENATEGYYYRLMGSFFICPIDDFIRCGMMDNNTFLYSEEEILAERMIKIKKKCYYLPTIKILHEHGFTTSKFLIKSDLIGLKSKLYYFKKYKGVSYLKLSIGYNVVKLYLFTKNIIHQLNNYKK